MKKLCLFLLVAVFATTTLMAAAPRKENRGQCRNRILELSKLEYGKCDKLPSRSKEEKEKRRECQKNAGAWSKAEMAKCDKL